MATNCIEIRAYGLQRSGNHAILDWVRTQHSGESCCFLNNVRHGDYDPYTHYTERYLERLNDSVDTETLRTCPKHLLIYSYEDDQGQLAPDREFLPSVLDPAFEANRSRYLGESEARLDLLIIRDPFNFFASRLKSLSRLSGVKDLGWIARSWKVLAKKALRRTENAEPGRCVANYNDWFRDEAYRRRLSRDLLGTFSDSTMGRVSVLGGGSSFDGQDFDALSLEKIARNWRELLKPRRYLCVHREVRRLFGPTAQEMKVMDRWRQCVNDEAYRMMLCDREIVELSEALFGEIAGTREFVRGL